MQQFFSGTDYALTLPIILLSLFGLGVLIIDLLLDDDWKQWNAITALIGLGFAAASVIRLQLSGKLVGSFAYLTHSNGQLVGSLLMDGFAIYFFYLFIVGAAIAILMSVKYLEIEREHHG